MVRQSQRLPDSKIRKSKTNIQPQFISWPDSSKGKVPDSPWFLRGWCLVPGIFQGPVQARFANALPNPRQPSERSQLRNAMHRSRTGHPRTAWSMGQACQGIQHWQALVLSFMSIHCTVRWIRVFTKVLLSKLMILPHFIFALSKVAWGADWSAYLCCRSHLRHHKESSLQRIQTR